MIRVKICGIGNPEDACVAAEAGADYIGMVFVPERHRRITPDDARDIVNAVRTLDAPAPRMVGLFADQPVEEVNEVVAHCALDAVQLCGQEGVEYAAAVDCEVIKVVHVPASYRAPDDVPQLAGRVQEYAEAGCLVTLDRLVEGIQGGTGQSFNLEVAGSLSSRGVSFLLAGGLTPANVGRAISIVRPWGVDVSSGVETIGKKDRRKIRRFVENARHADAALTGSA
ncbi:MAG: phosphoribosylanthranilate isomerase [Chloroflexi bacterium]|nr:phosphoribosylanthranilate isomerase [Chloroflexota bacterium]MYE40969.1 phosphoribosylanthranilate isomerase [Chloroflexota bacterium]